MADMVKAYKREADGKLRFRETWAMGGPRTRAMALHSGVVGNATGSFRKIRVEDREKHFSTFLEEARADGYEEIPEDEHHYLVVQFRLAGIPEDVQDWLHENAEESVNQRLGWRGLGMVEGYDFGGGVFNIFCLVVDIPLAVKGIRAIGTEHKQFKGRFTLGARAVGADGYTRVWPDDGDFDLF